MTDPGALDARFFQRLFEAAPHPYLILGADPQFSILAVNDMYLEATGTRRDAVVGHGLFEVFPDNPEDGSATGVSELRMSLMRVMADRRQDSMGVQKYDIPLRDGSGFEVRYWSVMNSPVLGADGELTCILHHAEDVTDFILGRERQEASPAGANPDDGERMRAEVMRRSAEVKEANRALKNALEDLERSRRDLAAMNERLSEMDQLKADFFANISHELRTPLTLILGPLGQRLDLQDLEPGLRSDLERMQRNARILLARVNDLLDLAKLDAGRMGLAFADVDLAQVVRLEASRFESHAESQGISFEVDAQGPLPARVDPEKVCRILANLLSNACRFTPRGGRIRVSLQGAPDRAVLAVEDTGPGIPEAMRSLVFDRFRQVVDGAERPQGGTGLGLAIVKEFAELHGGSVTLAGAPSGGALFRVELPLRSGEMGAGALPAWAHRDAAPAANPWASPVGPWGDPGPSAPRVLVVEDNPDMRDFLARTLTRTYRVTTAVDGEEGLRLALADPPDLVISDVMMPGMTGDRLVEELRAHTVTEDLPVILLTAKADDALRVRMLHLGVGDYLYKPFSFDELLARVGALLEGREKGLRAARIQETRFRAMFEQAAVGMAQASLDGHLLQVNQRLAEILGYAPEDLLGCRVQDLAHPEDLARDRDQMEMLPEGPGAAPALELRYRRKDGSVTWVNRAVSRVKDPGLTGGYLLLLMEDINARKVAERARVEADAALQDAQDRQLEMERELNHLQRLESIGRLAGGVAHDMNNVLAAILSVASVLEVKFAEEPTVTELARLMQEAAGRGRDLVKGLTDFARKEVQGSVPIDLNQLVRREAELLEHTTLKKVAIQLDLQPGLPELRGEPGALANALMNLCVNACDAMPGGGTLRLATRTLPLGKVELVVQDTGEGMAPEVMERALEPFFTTKPPGKGTGLGLSIVFGTLKAHGGTVAIQSAPGHGTRITLTLPIPAPGQAPAPEPVPPAHLERLLEILLVDDDEHIRRTLPMLLGTQGHRVRVASGGAEALALLQGGAAVDLVILDVNMPAMNGVETLMRLRTLRPALPVLVASGYMDPGAAAAIRLDPWVAALEKPFMLADIQRAMGTFFT